MTLECALGGRFVTGIGAAFQVPTELTHIFHLLDCREEIFQAYECLAIVVILLPVIGYLIKKRFGSVKDLVGTDTICERVACLRRLQRVFP